jgi:methylthioribose-1-phosphate isomerase
MKIAGKHYRSIWVDDDAWSVHIIDQTRLPHALEIVTLTTSEDAARAIETMQTRGAPLIGATAAYGMCLALKADPSEEALERAAARLKRTRPTAVNLAWAVDEIVAAVRNRPRAERAAAVRHPAQPVNVLTHCNAGWLATVDWGTALAPVYMAHDEGIDVHVWVDETRPRNQGAALTAFELGAHGVPHTIVADNAGGHLMQHGKVDLAIVGTDRTTRTGDVANKIGTYLKALAAKDNRVPFYVALPHSTIDWRVRDGLAEIPIEERSPQELTHASGRSADGAMVSVQLSAPGSPAANPAFDITPSRLVTGLITERGICPASEDGLLQLYPERKERQ